MINYYYSEKGEDVLVVDINKKWFVLITEYGEDYDYEEAKYTLQKFRFPYIQQSTLLNKNDFFKETLKKDGHHLYRNVIKTVFQQGD